MAGASKNGGGSRAARVREMVRELERMTLDVEAASQARVRLEPVCEPVSSIIRRRNERLLEREGLSPVERRVLG